MQRLPGVVDAVSGYANGQTAHPSYEDVIHGSGHAETVKVVRPGAHQPDRLLRYYFRVIDPPRSISKATTAAASRTASTPTSRSPSHCARRPGCRTAKI